MIKIEFHIYHMKAGRRTNLSLTSFEDSLTDLGKTDWPDDPWGAAVKRGGQLAGFQAG